MNANPELMLRPIGRVRGTIGYQRGHGVFRRGLTENGRWMNRGSDQSFEIDQSLVGRFDLLDLVGDFLVVLLKKGMDCFDLRSDLFHVFSQEVNQTGLFE